MQVSMLMEGGSVDGTINCYCVHIQCESYLFRSRYSFFSTLIANETLLSYLQ